MFKLTNRNVLPGAFPEPFLFVVNDTKITVVDLNSNYSNVVVNGFQNIKNFIIDPLDEKMYFKNEAGIYWANFDGYHEEVIYNYTENVIQIFAFEWTGRRMYIVKKDSAKNIFVGNMKFANKILLHSSAEDILHLAVDPYAG